MDLCSPFRCPYRCLSLRFFLPFSALSCTIAEELSNCNYYLLVYHAKSCKPPKLAFVVRCSIQLSYRRVVGLFTVVCFLFFFIPVEREKVNWLSPGNWLPPGCKAHVHDLPGRANLARSCSWNPAAPVSQPLPGWSGFPDRVGFKPVFSMKRGLKTAS